MNTLRNILDVVLNGANWFFHRKQEQTEDAQRAEDVELADAIKKGDSETVAQIRERRRRYQNTTILLLLVTGLFLGGCEMMRPRKTIPLATGTAPYQLPAGDYLDTKGQQHHEDTNRWSLCEQDLYNMSTVKVLKPKSELESLITRLIYGTMIAVGVVLGWIALRNMGRRFISLCKHGVTRDTPK